MIKYNSEEVADVKPHDRASTPKKLEEQIFDRTPTPEGSNVPSKARVRKRSRSTDDDELKPVDKKPNKRESTPTSLRSLERHRPAVTAVKAEKDGDNVTQFSAQQRKREPSSLPQSLDRHSPGVQSEKAEDISQFCAVQDGASGASTPPGSRASTPIQPVVEPDRAEDTPGTQLSAQQAEHPSSRIAPSGSGASASQREAPHETHTLIEVVLPNLKDVRRRQAALRQQVACADSVDVKAEPSEGNNQPPIVPIGDVGDDSNHAETLRNAVEQLRNPDAKVKKESQFSDEFLLGALGWEGLTHRYPISLPKKISEYGFSRYYISNLYGGSTQTTFPKISDYRVAWHGLADWAFLTLEFNPHAPTRPGHSGLFFSPRKAWDGWHGTQRPLRTFVRLAESKWVYMGQYKFEPGISLTSDEWKKQRDKVRSTWAYGVHVSQWGSEVTLRVWFRKKRGADYEPTKEEIEDATLRMGDIRKEVTLQDMIAAYDQGEEEIGTYKMTCVGYDEEFVRILERNAQLYKSPLTTAKKGTGKGTEKGKGKGTRLKRKTTKLESHQE